MLDDDANPAADPAAFAQMVKRSSTGELDRLMRGTWRGAVLGEIFDGMPGVFNAERAGAMDAVVHWRIADRADGGLDTYEVVIADGTCAVSRTPRHEPRLTLTIGAVDFVRMVTGNASPMMLFLRGRMKAKGDLGLTARFPSLFDIPKA